MQEDNNHKKVVHRTKAYRRRHMARVKRMLGRHKILIGLFLVIFSVVIIQVFYPKDRALPFAQFNGNSYAFMQRNQAHIRAQKEFEAMSILFDIDGRSEKVPIRELGASANIETSLAPLYDYPFARRFIPFSIATYHPHVKKVDLEFAQSPLDSFVKRFSERYNSNAISASLAINQAGEIIAKGDKNGHILNQEKLKNILVNRDYGAGKVHRVDVPVEVVAPKKQANDLADVKARAERALEKDIVITVQGSDESFRPDRSTVASWLRLSEGKKGNTELEIDKKKLNSYIVNIDKKLGKSPKPTIIKMVNDKEKSRTKGTPGRRINRDETEQKISSILFTEQLNTFVAVTFEPIAPNKKYKYSYTYSQEGLQAKVNKIGRSSDVRISIKQLDGKKWRAQYRASQSTPSASTYKLFVALRLFEDINSGNISWNDSILDTNVSGCFERMIVVSTNQCAENWINTFGRKNINNFVYSKGFSRATTFTHPVATHTSAEDLRKAVEGIYDGSLASGNNRDQLLSRMKRQIWRSGIPTGTAGWAHDKVGFLWDYVHDTAIVHHPKGTYTITVMTKGSGYATIAQIIRELEGFMYP